MKERQGGLKLSESALNDRSSLIQHVFIIGAKSIGQYGGYETFIDGLTAQHSREKSIKYHIVTKENGSGAMDETRLEGVSKISRDKDGCVRAFTYHGARIVKLTVPQFGAAQAVIYDVKAFEWCLLYIKKHNISNAVIYVLACRIGPFFGNLVRKAHRLGARVFINPDGHEWMRAKWNAAVRKYWKLSEKLMVRYADTVICDSVNIEKYIRDEYKSYSPKTRYIAYGADTAGSSETGRKKAAEWLEGFGLGPKRYYLIVGRFVPENNYETMLREFSASHTDKTLAVITNKNDKFSAELEKKLHYSEDKRIRFVGTVYDAELLKAIRENAYAYIHGHEVGGTNPSLLEALASTELSLLLDVGFNREVGGDAALYWSKERGSLSSLIDRADALDSGRIAELSEAAKSRIRERYSWELISEQYSEAFREAQNDSM